MFQGSHLLEVYALEIQAAFAVEMFTCSLFLQLGPDVHLDQELHADEGMNALADWRQPLLEKSSFAFQAAQGDLPKDHQSHFGQSAKLKKWFCWFGTRESL